MAGATEAWIDYAEAFILTARVRMSITNVIIIITHYYYDQHYECYYFFCTTKAPAWTCDAGYYCYIPFLFLP